MTQKLLRAALVAGFLVSVFLATFQPGLATAALLVAFIGWSRENALRVGAMARLRDAALEIEREAVLDSRMAKIEASQLDILEALSTAAILKIVKGHGTTVTVSTVVDDLGEPPTKAAH